jgi:uncharacterized protein (DUF433 family)
MDERELKGPDATLTLHADRPPLRVDEGSAVRVGKSRISLDLVVEQYENGMTPEDMVRAYDTLELADVHAVIAYYLRHREEVQAYLKRREEQAEALRAKIEAERPRVSRQELLARRSVVERGVSPVSDIKGSGYRLDVDPPQCVSAFAHDRMQHTDETVDDEPDEEGLIAALPNIMNVRPIGSVHGGSDAMAVARRAGSASI